MYKTPLNKRLPYTAKRNSKILPQKEQIRSFNSYNNSLILHSNSKNIDENYRHRVQSSLKEETMSIMKQLATSYFYSICENFQQAFTDQMNLLNQKFLMLEYQLANLQKKFNAIEIQLHKKSKQIVAIVDQNKTLIELNNDIEQRIQQLRQKYQISHTNMKNEWLENKINQFRNEIKEYEMRNKQCQSCQKGIKQRIRKQLNRLQESKNQNPYDQIIKDTLKSIIQTVYSFSQQKQDDYLRGWKQKLMQNIDLKFNIISLQQKIEQLNLKMSLEKPKSEQKQNK